MGPRQRPGAALAARLRGAGARALERPARALPPALRRGQHPGRRPDHAGAVLPPAAPAGAARLPQAADRHDAQEPAAAQAGRLAGRPPDRRATSTTCSTTRPPPTACAGCSLCSGKVYYDLSPAAPRSAASATWPSSGVEQLYPWPAERAQGGARSLPIGPRVGLGAGGVAEHGGLDVRRPAAAGAAGDRRSQYVGRDASASPATGSKARPRPRAGRDRRGRGRRGRCRTWSSSAISRTPRAPWRPTATAVRPRSES